MKQTAVAPSNIAFIKFWGKKNEQLRLPSNGSIAVNLSKIYSTTTVDFSSDYSKDLVIINQKENKKETLRVSRHLDRIRELAGTDLRAKVISENNFPKASGLASSASGFAALTLAAVKAVGLNLSQKKLTTLARLGSGSACRSIPDGFVEWKEGKDDKSSYAYSIFPASFWNLSIIAVLVEKGEKKISSTDGQRLVGTSPFFKTRLKNINQKIVTIKRLIQEKNFYEFGQLVENEALEMHSIMLTSSPSLVYWQPATIEVIKLTHRLRTEGLLVYFTIDAGPNLYLICERKDEAEVLKKLKEIQSIKKIIVNYPANGAKLLRT